MTKYAQKIDWNVAKRPKGERPMVYADIPLPFPKDAQATAVGYVRTIMEALQAMLESLEDGEEK